MATDHKGRSVGNPNTSHGGHEPTPMWKPIMNMPWDDDHLIGSVTERMWDKYDSNPYNDDEVLNLSYQGVDPADIIVNRRD
jgi:hypothetical protein